MTDHSDLIAELRTIAEYVCWDKFEGRFISDPKKHPAWRAADALSSQSLSLSEAREGLGLAEDWSAKLAELYAWSGSAFLAGEKVDDEADHKSRLYGFLCGLIGYLMAGRDVASALESSKPNLADATNAPDPDLSSLRKGAEVVAWRIRPIGDQVWHLTDDPRPRLGYEMQPLALVSGSREERDNG